MNVFLLHSPATGTGAPSNTSSAQILSMPSNSTDKCYLCGATENLTRDHIPPKGLFPKPRPSNLYTVPCCYSCNNGAAKEDEYLRVAASSLINANTTGKAAFERVVESTLPS